ncbi:MAG: hypothetical protein GJ677_16950 [Rhodobacteraceae bacterium]|nr:hypothetical protein [Paracoccaceae bacterium]
MKQILATVAPIVMALFVAGCMGSEQEVSKSSTPGPLQIYSIRAVDVALADNARINDMARLETSDDKKVAADIKANVEAALKSELNQRFTGKTPATLKVRIQMADVRTGAGHVLGTSSFLTSEVSLIDNSSGKSVRKGVIQTEYRGARGGGNLGTLVMIAANAGTTKAKRYKELAEQFANQVTSWAQ